MTKSNQIEKAVVYLVDDEEAIRDSLCFLIESAGLTIKCYGSAEDFLNDYDSDCPGCLILDVLMTPVSGIELQERMLELGIKMPIIFISGHGDFDISTKAFRLGAMDFFEKPFDNALFLERIKEALGNDYDEWVKKQMKKSLLERYQHLTDREKQVMKLVANNCSNKEAARILGISNRTVDIHRAKLMEKMQAESLSDLVVMAVNCDLIQNYAT